MGRRNKQYSLDLRQQAYNKLTAMLKAGEGHSKQIDKMTENTKDKIYSFSTYNTYWKHTRYFLQWIKEYHPDCTTLDKAKSYVNDWLEYRTKQFNNRGDQLSAWTIQTEAAALNKLFGIDKADPNRFQPPRRNRMDIKRSRTETIRDRHFSIEKNMELIDFCRGTGCRLNILQKLEGRDLWTKDQMIAKSWQLSQKNVLSSSEKRMLDTLKDALNTFPDQDTFLHHRKDKGGKFRFSPIIGDSKDRIIQRMKQCGLQEKIWPHIHSACDVHGYRRDYATSLYRMYARDTSKIPYDRINRGTGHRYQSDVYICRKDESGRRLDKSAMQKVSKALGHNRLEIVAKSYLRD